MNFYSSILAALFARSNSPAGHGQRVTSSQTGATLHFQRASVQRFIRAGQQTDDGNSPGSGKIATQGATQQFQCGSDGLVSGLQV
jgi:hypothetical protein